MVRFFVAVGRYGIYFLVFLIAWILAFSAFKSHFLAPAEPKSTQTVLFEVQRGTNLRSISQDLEKRKLVNHWYSVYYLSKLKAGKGDKIVAGEYELSPSLSPAKIYDVLTSGKVVIHELKIIEGASVRELPRIMEATTLVTAEDALRALNNRTLLAESGVPALTAEGYMFPDTYHFSRPVTAEEMVKRIIDEGQKKIEDKLKGWKERAQQLMFTPYQILTLASIIEKETGRPEERGLISSVFHNRLRVMMPLQSDPTVIYGLDYFDGNLTKEHLKRQTPYNTYINLGLPPTPICNPGLESIKAALYPEDTNYLYFVSKGDGSHQFSETYKQHVAAVESFQKMRQQP